jgi:hypothetical protein
VKVLGRAIAIINPSKIKYFVRLKATNTKRTPRFGVNPFVVDNFKVVFLFLIKSLIIKGINNKNNPKNNGE